jgi:hypothetical protein
MTRAELMRTPNFFRSPSAFDPMRRGTPSLPLLD